MFTDNPLGLCKAWGYEVATDKCYDGTPAANTKGKVHRPEPAKTNWYLYALTVPLLLLPLILFCRPTKQVVDIREKRLEFYEN